jgi:hypothetical protein
VTCTPHGRFQVSFSKHLKGAGCPECTNRYNGRAGKYFVKRARAVHGKKYRYGSYRSAPSKMEIECPIHGIFKQAAATHLRGHGCQGCANDRKRLLAKGGYSAEFFALHPEMRERPATLYVIGFTKGEESFIKVGITRTSVTSRLKSGYRKYSWRMIASRPMCLYEAFCLEQALLKRFKGMQVFPRQDNFVGKTECLLSSCIGPVLSFLNDKEPAATSPNSIPVA